MSIEMQKAIRFHMKHHEILQPSRCYKVEVARGQVKTRLHTLQDDERLWNYATLYGNNLPVHSGQEGKN